MLQRTQWPVIGVLAFSLAWATTYVVQVRLNPLDGPEALYFIEPLLVALWLVAPFVLWSAIGARPKRLDPDPATPINDSSRISLIASLPAYFALIAVVGLPAASTLYVVITAFLYGERSLTAIIALPLLILAIVILGFIGALGVQIPMVPIWWK